MPRQLLNVFDVQWRSGIQHKKLLGRLLPELQQKDVASAG